MCFVIIPISYISNTEAVKSYLLTTRCCTTFVDIFRSNKINPVTNEGVEMNLSPKEQDVPKHRPTISSKFKDSREEID